MTNKKTMSKKQSNPGNRNSTQKKVPENIRRYARFLDSRFRIGDFRFGIEPILGLIPGIGDFLGILLSGRLIAMASKHVSGKVMVLMSLNALLDGAIGSIPVLGDIFDFFYRANDRNVRILEKHFRQGKYKGSGKGLIVIILVVFVALTVLAIYGIWEIVTYLLALI